MKKLIETIARASEAYPELDAFREALFSVMEIEDEPKRVVLGFGASFIEISETKIEFVFGADRITIEELARIKSLTDDLRSRLLLPFTEGTDEDFDVDRWVDGAPTMPNNIVGGWQPGNGGGAIDDEVISASTTWSSYKITIELGGKVASDDPRLSDARAPIAHNHVISNVTGLQSALDAKQNIIASAALPSLPTENQMWIEPNAYAAQPWVYKSGNWYSDMMALDFPVPSFTTGDLTMSKLIPARIPRVWIDNIYAQLRSSASAGSDITNNYYTMRLRAYRRDGSFIDLVSFNNQSQQLGTSRFNTTQPANQPIENVAYIEFYISRVGATSGFSLTTSATIDLRYGR